MTTRLTPHQRTLVEDNKGLAEKISHDYRQSAPGLDIEEIVAVAYQGLVTAAQGFDPDKGVPFGGYARQMIHWEIKMWMRKEDYLQRNIRADYKRMLESGYSERAVITEELATRSGLTMRRMQTVIRAVVAKPSSSDNLVDAEMLLANPDVDVESSALASSLQGSVAAVVQNLPAIQQIVLALHYFEGLELRQIAETLGTSLSSVRQAHSEAVMAVHAEMVRQARQQG